MPPPPAALLRRRLGAVRRRLTGAAVTRGALVTLGVLSAALAAALAVEAGLWLGVELRTAVFWTLAGLLTLLLAGGVVGPVLRGLGVLPGLDEAAVLRRTGQDFPGVDDRLATFLDLADGHAVGGDRLRDAALADLGREVEAIPFERVRAFETVRETARWAVAPLALLAALVAVWPGPMTAAATRLMAPGVYFAPPAPFRLAVTPGDAEVTRGADLAITASTTGAQLPLAATLEYGRADERATETVALAAGADGAFAHTLDAVRADLRYRIEADGVRSPWFAVRVVDRPLVRGLRLRVTPPGYSGRASRLLPEGVGDVTGLVGSTVTVQVGHGGPSPDAAWLDVDWEDGRRQRVPLTVGSEAARGAFRLRGAGTYTVRLRAGALENTDPARYALGTLSDGPPQIVLVEGGEGALSDAPRRLVFRVTDDFGFRGGSVVYRLTRGGTTGRPRRLALGVRTRPLDQEVGLVWQTGARPGDVIELYGQVSDNDGRGAKAARTPLVTLRYPSLADRLDDLGARRDSTVQTLERLDDQARQSQERFERLRRDLRQNLDPDWEDRRQVEELMREQQALRDQAQSLQEQMNQLRQQMQDAELGDEQTMQQLEQMQSVMQELDSPELRDALERLREAMEQLDMRQMLEQSDQAAQAEDDFRRRLERALELMKRLEAAVEMEEIARRAEDLAETEEALARETEQAGDEASRAERQRLAEQQRQAAEQAEQLGQQVDDLREQIDELSNAPEDAIEQMQEQLDSERGLPQEMQDNAEQLEQGEMQDAQDGQQEMSDQLRQMAQTMRQQSQQMQGQQRKVDQAALRRALEDVLTMSRDQEALATTTARTPSQNPSLVGAARRQSEIRDGLRAVVDTLRRVARTVPQLGPEIDQRALAGRREMDAAVEQLAERQSGPAAGHQRAAMSHLNDLALLLADVLEQLQDQAQQQGSAGSQGTPRQMQQIGQQQQRLNQQIQQMLNESAGERLSGDQAQRMRQMAEAQERLRRQLERAREGAGGGLDPRDRSALQRVEEQMRESAEQLRRGRTDQRTAPRQQQILEQLLETERSVNQRGRQPRREAHTGSARTPPPAPPPRTVRPADRIRGDLIRALESGYAPDYQDLIKRYFERLQARSDG